MKHLTLTLTALSATLASATVSAHVGEHDNLGLLTGAAHLLSEHALPIAVLALIAGGLLIKRVLRA